MQNDVSNILDLNTIRSTAIKAKNGYIAALQTIDKETNFSHTKLKLSLQHTIDVTGIVLRILGGRQPLPGYKPILQDIFICLMINFNDNKIVASKKIKRGQYSSGLAYQLQSSSSNRIFLSLSNVASIPIKFVLMRLPGAHSRPHLY